MRIPNTGICFWRRCFAKETGMTTIDTNTPVTVTVKPGKRGKFRWDARQGNEFLALGHPRGYETPEEAEAAATTMLLAKVEWVREGC